ncbi:hypothetical protein Vqi01_58550 [Micromonospora qiuiae]|uniref:Uncharacterized protein n=1 Tax=Micromonospora qiuiae TaxID=502268 RepID=A0ABQ4JJB7_9ACTN|nr:hypothetical protein Vqi01_58550 [Micromonospora qiuiae]
MVVAHIDSPAEGHELVYQVRLPVSSHTFALVTEAIRTYRRQVKSRWAAANMSPEERA